MMKFYDIYKKVRPFWPDEIDVSDGCKVGEGGYSSENLSMIWDEVENNEKVHDDWSALMVWSIFGVLHSEAKKNKGKIILDDIEIKLF